MRRVFCFENLDYSRSWHLYKDAITSMAKLHIGQLLMLCLFFAYLGALEIFWLYLISLQSKSLPMIWQCVLQDLCVVFNSKNWVRLAVKLAKFWLTTLHSSVFGKFRGLVGEIKYAFAYIPCLKRNAMHLWLQIIFVWQKVSISNFQQFKLNMSYTQAQNFIESYSLRAK